MAKLLLEILTSDKMYSMVQGLQIQLRLISLL